MCKNNQLLVKKLLLLFVTLIITILVAEFLLRISYPLYANYNTEMARYAKEIKVIRNEQYFEHPSNKTGRYYGVKIRTNSMGWREDRDYSLVKPHGVKRIIVLGDSITLGWGVELNQTYPKVLEQLLNNDPSLRYRYEVINTGVGNYNTFLELEMLKRTLSYDPDMIILGWFINDVEVWSKANTLVSFLGGYSYFYGFLWDKLFSIGNKLGFNENYETYYQRLYTSNHEGISQFEKSFDSIVHLAKERGIPLLFLNIPDLHNIKPYPFDLANEYIKNVVTKRNVHYLNLLNSVKGTKPEKLWVSFEDPHPNAMANSIFGNRIYHFLEKEGLVD